jgi:hypothetical protein
LKAFFGSNKLPAIGSPERVRHWPFIEPNFSSFDLKSSALVNSFPMAHGEAAHGARGSIQECCQKCSLLVKMMDVK